MNRTTTNRRIANTARSYGMAISSRQSAVSSREEKSVEVIRVSHATYRLPKGLCSNPCRWFPTATIVGNRSSLLQFTMQCYRKKDDI